MSQRLALKAFKSLMKERPCSFVRHGNLLSAKREQIVAINLLTQKRVGPLMMYSQKPLARRLLVMRTKNAAPILKTAAVLKKCTGANRGAKKLFPRSVTAFTLAEVVVCLAIVALLFGGIITGYMQGAYRAEWAGYNLAAQALAMQQIEQAKSAKWDKDGVNEFTNLLTLTWAVLDLPCTGTNRVYATNYVTVTTNQISSTPDVFVQMVKVDTVWPYIRKGQVLYYTNTVADYYAKD